MKRTLVILAFLVIAISCIAQKPKFKDVSKEDLALDYSTIDSSAVAEYLYRGVEMEYTYNSGKQRFEVVYSYHLRIKVYDEDGKSYTDLDLPFYKGIKTNESEKIKNIEAYTFNLVDGKVKKTKLKKNGIFLEKTNKYYSRKKIALPNVQKGSIVDIKYKKVSQYYFRIDEFYFQMDIPVKYAEFKVTTPEYFNYNYNAKGLIPLKLDQKKSQGRLTINYVVESSPSSADVSRRDKRTQELNFNTDNRLYHAFDIPPVKNEPYVFTMDNYKSSMKMELLYTDFPNTPPKYYTKTWNDIAKLLTNDSNFGGQLSKNYKGVNDILTAVEGKSNEEKIITIFSEVQKRFTWNGYDGKYSEKGIAKFIKQGSGNIADINLLLVNLLNKAEIDAFPLVSSKSSSGFLNISNPSIADLDYVIAGVFNEDGTITYLDATDKHLSPNMLPFRALNLKNILITGETAKEIPITNPNKGNLSQVFDLALNGTTLNGTIKQSIKGYEAYSLRKKYSSIEDLTKGCQSDNIQLNNLEVHQFTDKYVPIKVNGVISLDGYIQEIDDKLFIDLNIGDDEFENPFKSDDREFALFFPSKRSYVDVIKLTLPEGYKVEAIPESLNITTHDKILTYLVKIDIIGNDIVISRRNSLNKTIINPEYYIGFKDLYNQVEAKMKEKIVLAKI